MRPTLTALTLLAATQAAALDCPEGQRAFSHPVLTGSEACVPDDPRRIAFLSEEGFNAYLLGVPSVTRNWDFDQLLALFPNRPEPDWPAGTVDAGWSGEADPEVVATARPDLIVANTDTPELNERLALIAPVVSREFEGAAGDWRMSDDFVARLVGAEARLAEALGAIDARIADFRARLPEAAPTFVVVRAPEPPDSTVEVDTEFRPGVRIAQEAGLALHGGVLSSADGASLGSGGAAWYPLSLERVGDVDADFVVVLPNGDSTSTRRLLEDPLFASLAAVREGRVVVAGGQRGEHWGYAGAAFAHLVMDELYAGVLGLDPAPTPNPHAGWMTVVE